jgi:Four helix bundle sensory module for signal transduction
MILSENNIIKHTLSLGFVLIIVLFVSFGIITIKGLITIGNLTKTIYEHPLVVSNASLNAALNVVKMHRSMKDVVLATSLNEIDFDLRTVAEIEQTVYQQLDTIRENIIGDEGKKLEKETRQLFIGWKPIRDEVIRLLKSGNKIDAITITRAKGADHVAKLEAKMMDLFSYARNKATGFLNQAETSYSHLEKITIILTVVGVFLSVVIAIVASYRVIKAEKVLLEEKNKLQEAFNEIKTLRGIIPICSHCKKIRNDDGIWEKIEKYFDEHSEAKFSHGICPDCMTKYYSGF